MRNSNLSSKVGGSNPKVLAGQLARKKWIKIIYVISTTSVARGDGPRFVRSECDWISKILPIKMV